MTKLLSTLALATVCGMASAQAGTTQVDYTKQIETPIVESRIGVGFYAAVFGGANVHQDADFGELDDDFDIDVDLDSETGWFAGLKLGYVFDTGSFILPAIELEGFYNNVDVNLHARSDDFDVTSEIGGELDQVVLQLNFQLKFDLGRFRPYIGAGAGAAYLESDEIRGRVRVDGDEILDFEGDVDDFGIDNEGWVFAWQALGGFDYYFTDNFSVFAEYKALFFHGNNDEIDYYLQHLVGGGVRFHF
jgi:opacity protein-like surface antigen